MISSGWQKDIHFNKIDSGLLQSHFRAISSNTEPPVTSKPGRVDAVFILYGYNTVIERMEITAIINKYAGGGTSRYHPRMLLKSAGVRLCMKVYMGKRLAKALREDLNFM